VSGLNAVSTGLRDVRFGRRRVVVLAPEQAVYSVRYVVVDRIDHVRATAGHGGDGPTHDSHHGALTDSQEQEHCCRPVGRHAVGVSQFGVTEQLLPCVPIGARDEGCSGRRCEDPAAVERGSMHSMPHFARSSRRTVRHWPNGGVSYYDCRVEVHRSARKHGISDDDIHTAAQQYLIAYTIDDDQPPRELRLGFDTEVGSSRSSSCSWTTAPSSPSMP